MPPLTDILKKVRRLEIRARRLSNHMLAGEYHSAFRGRGITFREVREYVPGDDIRFIDWNVSARFGHTFSKLFSEERSLTVMLLLDMSASNQLGSGEKTKLDLLAEMTALLGFSAISNQDKVGAILFTDRVEAYIPPARGRQHLLFMLRKILTFSAAGSGTDLAIPLRFLQKISRQGTICFLISDFNAGRFLPAMKAAAVKHDGIAIHLFDRLDTQLPAGFLVALRDSETGEPLWVDTHAPGWQKRQEQEFAARATELKSSIRSCGWEYLRFRSDHDVVPVLQQFFRHRSGIKR